MKQLDYARFTDRRTGRAWFEVGYWETMNDWVTLIECETLEIAQQRCYDLATEHPNLYFY